jgi:hypothetical protein
MVPGEQTQETPAMPVRALDLSQRFDHISEFDDATDPDVATIWHLGVLSSRDVGRIRDMATSLKFKTGVKEDEATDDDVETSIARAKMNFEAVRLGLTGWSNFLDANGNTLDFKTVKRDVAGRKRDVVPDELLDMIPLDVIEELANLIMGQNVMADNEPGNSQGPSTDA